jgi:disulfide oxidoreductase YuzD
MVSVGIRYCGGCNPEIDRTRLVERLQEEMKKRHVDVAFTTDRDRVTDITLLVNGCAHGCLEEEFLQTENQTPYLSVKGEMVGDTYIAEKDIPSFLAQEIVRYLPLYE